MDTASGYSPILVAGICGSLGRSSYTRMAVQAALRGAEELGARTLLIDLRDYNLPFCMGGRDAEADYPDDVFRLRRDLRAASGIIIGTPEYHGSLSGVLKNALDLTGFDEFEGKPVGLVGISGGATGAYDALNSLRSIGRALHAWVVPQQASIAEVKRAFDEDGKPVDVALAERLLEIGRQVVRFADFRAGMGGNGVQVAAALSK